MSMIVSLFTLCVSVLKHVTQHSHAPHAENSPMFLPCCKLRNLAVQIPQCLPVCALCIPVITNVMKNLQAIEYV